MLLDDFINRVAEKFQVVGIVSFTQRLFDGQDEDDRFCAVIEAEFDVILKNFLLDRADDGRLLVRNEVGRQTDKYKFNRLGLCVREEVFCGEEALI